MKTKKQKRQVIILVILIAVLTASCAFNGWINPWFTSFMQNTFNVVTVQGNMLVHFISIGQGDAAAINLPDGKVAVIDTGEVDQSSTLVSYIRNKVLSVDGDNVIDYLILSHADSDHVGGALNLLKNFEVRTIYLPTIGSNSSTYTNLINHIEAGNYTVKTNADGTTIGDGYTFKFYGPFAEFDDTNDSSPIIKLTYGTTDFLFTGDIGEEAELKAVEVYGSELDCEILKVAHHGSKYSTCDAFLNAVTPEISVISCGYNTYGHPTDEVLNKLTDANSAIYRTDNDGNVLFTLSENDTMGIVTGKYIITNLPFNYCLFVLAIDGILLLNIVLVIIKKPSKKPKQKSKR